MKRTAFISLVAALAAFSFISCSSEINKSNNNAISAPLAIPAQNNSALNIGQMVNPVAAGTLRGAVYKKEKIGSTYHFTGWACAFNNTNALAIKVWLGIGTIARGKLIVDGVANIVNANNKAQCGVSNRNHGFDLSIAAASLPAGITSAALEANNLNNIHIYARDVNSPDGIELPVSLLNDQLIRSSFKISNKGDAYYIPSPEPEWKINHADFGANVPVPVADNYYPNGFKIGDQYKSIKYSNLGEFLLSVNANKLFNHTYREYSDPELGNTTQWPAIAVLQDKLWDATHPQAVAISELKNLYIEMELQLIKSDDHYRTATNQQQRNVANQKYGVLFIPGITVQNPTYNHRTNNINGINTNFFFLQVPMYSSHNQLPTGVNRQDIVTGVAMRGVPYSRHGVETLWNQNIVRIKTDILPDVKAGIDAVFGTALGDYSQFKVGSFGMGFEMNDLHEVQIRINHADLTQIVLQK